MKSTRGAWVRLLSLSLEFLIMQLETDPPPGAGVLACGLGFGLLELLPSPRLTMMVSLLSTHPDALGPWISGSSCCPGWGELFLP